MLALETRTALGPLALDAAFTVAAGECLALAGPSGAGKTSLLRVAAGLLSPASGSVECGGEVWLDTARGVSVAPDRRQVGYLFQDYALFPNLSVWRNVAFGMQGTSRKHKKKRALELLDRFGMASRADDRPRGLSGGERQRVALARVLARRPRALLLDEPLSALDPRTRASASRSLAEVLEESDVPSVLVTHAFEEATLLSDRVAVIDEGRVVQTGSAAALAAAPATAFVADLMGAAVLTGTARPGPSGLTEVELDGGGTLRSTDAGSGRVAATVHSWEISLEGPGHAAVGSAQNRLPARVTSVTPVANRVRVGLLVPQPLTAELTDSSASNLDLCAGADVVAVWKATATRLLAL